MSTPIYIGCDHDVTYSGATGDTAYLNSAAVTYALYTAAGAAVAGGTGTCDYVAASNGNYRGVLQSAVTALLTDGARYRLDVTFVQGNYDDFRRLDLVARYRRGT